MNGVLDEECVMTLDFYDRLNMRFKNEYIRVFLDKREILQGMFLGANKRGYFTLYCVGNKVVVKTIQISTVLYIQKLDFRSRGLRKLADVYHHLN